MAKQDQKKTTSKKAPVKKAAAKKAPAKKGTAKKAPAKKAVAKKAPAAKTKSVKKTIEEAATAAGIDVTAIKATAEIKIEEAAEKEFDAAVQRLEFFVAEQKPKLLKRLFSWLKK
jgi:hypothetical protein